MIDKSNPYAGLSQSGPEDLLNKNINAILRKANRIFNVMLFCIFASYGIFLAYAIAFAK